MSTLWLGECPEPACSLPAELIRTDRWESTDGPLETRRTRCLAGHLRDSHPVPVPLPRQMSCPSCACEAHSPFVCGNEIAPGVRCPCRVVPTPGVHPDDGTDCSALWVTSVRSARHHTISPFGVRMAY